MQALLGGRNRYGGTTSPDELIHKVFYLYVLRVLKLLAYEYFNFYYGFSDQKSIRYLCIFPNKENCSGGKEREYGRICFVHARGKGMPIYTCLKLFLTSIAPISAFTYKMRNLLIPYTAVFLKYTVVNDDIVCFMSGTG